ncbi:PfkB family carbohydrate kinase [Virgibacillus sp. C22-A2]|uniref:PfkB family carbohydrate kinase n=1 Tax=Virgibacillus tibetensis TaxID=3042313 RepID=A0ABU6KIX1_9BACI|nr:PfkB family carbohydrate kinase [Virgibacillus sp. C22-A2]
MNKENQILHHIKMNPFISQQELSKKVGLSRSAVANYIANLTRRGEIKGRAYVIQNQSSVVCIGGTNTDRKAQSDQKVHLHTSNPVKITEVCGGVARNFAENLSRLGYSTSLITCVGDDAEGDWLLNETKHQGVDVSQAWVLHSKRTGTYTALLDVTGKMVVSMADMNIYEYITIEMIEDKWSYIAKAKAVFLDTNIPEDCINYLIKRCRDEDIVLYINPVSAAKVQKLPHCLDGVDVLLLNQEEAEVLIGEKINSVEVCQQACEEIRQRGVRKVIIMLDSQGVYYSSLKESGHLAPFETDMVDSTGSDDAFASCAIYGIMSDESLRSACQLGLAGYALTQQSERSVSTLLKPEKIHELVEVYLRDKTFK